MFIQMNIPRRKPVQQALIRRIRIIHIRRSRSTIFSAFLKATDDSGTGIRPGFGRSHVDKEIIVGSKFRYGVALRINGDAVEAVG